MLTAVRTLASWLFAAILVLSAEASDPGDIRTVFVVRHAEKAAEPKKDPPLTETGTARAELLKRMLLDANVYGLFATELQRSSLTLLPLADELGLLITEVESDDPYGMAETVLAAGHEVSVVSAHSDTVIPILEGLGVADLPAPPIRYDDFFIVSIPADGGAGVLRLKYGPESP